MAIHRNLTGPDAVHPFAIISATDPGAIGAGKAWLNTATTPHTLKYRNAANLAWEDIQTDGAGSTAISLSVQFGDGVTADAAGAVRIVPGVPVGLTPVGWSILPDASCSATFTVEKSPPGAPVWSSLVGTGTAPAITAQPHAADTDGAVDWSGGSVLQFGAIKVTLATYTAGASKLVGFTLLCARV